ncbi:MAG: hypothetical protein E7676_02770 [Ruminococcaceae bacterium]|nr:hypothetical protein [Oscillospiraceae bacterium]
MKQRTKVDLNYFPGWTRKSLSFSIDDGKLEFDRKFIEIVKPVGIRGTFNLCDTTKATAQEYRELYEGFEIANHCKHHPRAADDGIKFIISDNELDRDGGENYTAERPVVYKTTVEGVYYCHPEWAAARPGGWFTIADAEYYIKYVDEAKRELEAVFGEGRVRGFVWPFYKQYNSQVREHLVSSGYYGTRSSGDVLDKTGFALPTDWIDWSYNACDKTMLALMEKYEEYPDDGELKFFCLGVHSRDYEVRNKWDALREFAQKYGNRPNDYFYATNAEIYDYQAAVNSARITDGEIINESGLPLYAKIGGEKIIIHSKSIYKI